MMGARLAAVWMAGIVLAAGSVCGFEITNNQQIDGTSPQIVGEDAVTSGDNTITPSGASPNWTYTWADRDGDATSNAVATAGLDLGEYKLFCDYASPQGVLLLDLAGGSIQGSDGVAIQTFRAANTSIDSIAVENVNNIAMGGIETYALNNSGDNADRNAGSIRIGTADARANNVRVQYLHAYGGGTSTRARGGEVAIYSSNDVLVANADTSEIGKILAYGNNASQPGVTIDHAGSLRVDGIETWTGGRGTGPVAGAVTLDGGNAEGNANIGYILACSYKTGGYGNNNASGSITVRNYANVAIGGIDTSFRFGSNYAGDVDITDNIANDITITGAIDLNQTATPARKGRLWLKAGRTVTLAELDMDKVLWAELDSGSGTNVITGELANFDTTSSSGSGTLADPVLTTQTALRAPDGQKILYDVETTPYLGGRVYKVANLAGTANEGGLLMPDDYDAGDPKFTPMIDTDPATDILHTSATLNGTLTDLGSSAVTAVSVYWSAVGDQGIDTNAWVTSTGGGVHHFAGPFSAQSYDFSLTGLSQDTVYTFRFQAENAEGVAWGYHENFLTLEEPQATLNVDQITHHSARLIGTVTQGKPTPTAYFCLKAGMDPAPAASTALDSGDWDIVLDMGSQSAGFSYTLGGLSADTTYYAYVYVENETKGNWSALSDFSTDAMPTIPADLTLSGNVSLYNAMTFSNTTATLAPIGEGTASIYDFSSFNANHASLSLGGFNLTSGNDTYTTLRFNDGALYSTGGYIQSAVSANQNTRDIEIYDVGDIALGDGYIRASKTGGGSGSSGPIRIGTAESPAGSVQAAYIECTSQGPYGIYIHSGGNVHMTNTAAVAGNLDVSTSAQGDLHVLHAGSLQAAAVKLIRSAGSSSARQYEVVFDGAAYAQNSEPSGTFEVTEIVAYGENTHSGHHTIHGHMTIVRNYLAVTVDGEIDTRATRTSTGNQNGYGGDIAITNIVGDIAISGVIDARNDTRTDRWGSLTLQAGGTITLGSLSLANVREAYFDADGDVEILGAITGDDDTALSGDGSTLANGGNLHLPAGQTMVYHPDQNPALNEGTYTLTGGGELKAWQATGTIIRFR